MNSSQMKTQFQNHLNYVAEANLPVFEKSPFNRVVIDCGMHEYYFQDDMEKSFHPYAHFKHWCPAPGRGHVLLIRPSVKPKLFFFQPKDHWDDYPAFDSAAFWVDGFDIELCETRADMWSKIGTEEHTAYLGSDLSVPNDQKWTANPDDVLLPFNWNRRAKTEFEKNLLLEATRVAVEGHNKVADSFFKAETRLNLTERDLYWTYTQTIDALPDDVAYAPIIGFNEHGATLHYRGRSHEKTNPNVLLIDAGAKFMHYCSDITRTHLRDETHPVFKDIHSKLDSLQLALCDMVKPGIAFHNLQIEALKGVAQILLDLNIIKNITASDALHEKIVQVFLPHGLGHHLGLHVHDVAGKQKSMFDWDPVVCEEFPTLRNTGFLELHNVITMEPGVYFNPILLDASRSNTENFNWDLIDQLIPCGGIRIEDNLYVTETGSENMTRDAFRLADGRVR